MPRAGLAAFVIVALAAGWQPAFAACVDWAATGRFADVEAATAVFEGAIIRIEHDRTTQCAPDKVYVQVRRTWKGPQLSEQVVLQESGVTHEMTLANGVTVPVPCPSSAESTELELGKRYIVFASGEPGHLYSFPCQHTGSPTKQMRKRLDLWRECDAQRGITTRCS